MPLTRDDDPHALRDALIAFFMLVALFIACRPHRALSATWVHISFTVPDSGIARIRAETAPLWDSVRVYGSPGTEGVQIGPAGSQCDFYVSQSIQPLTSRTYRVIGIDHAGNRSGASNLVVVATGFPDTIACLSRPARGAFNDYGFVRTYGVTYWGWSLTYGDSAPVSAMHFEAMQRQQQPRECALFGKWALRGVQAVCP